MPHEYRLTAPYKIYPPRHKSSPHPEQLCGSSLFSVAAFPYYYGSKSLLVKAGGPHATNKTNSSICTKASDDHSGTPIVGIVLHSSRLAESSRTSQMRTLISKFVSLAFAISGLFSCRFRIALSKKGLECGAAYINASTGYITPKQLIRPIS